MRGIAAENNSINLSISMSILLIFGMFMPTSINGEVSEFLRQLTFVITLFFYCYLIFRLNHISKVAFYSLLLMILFSGIFSVTSPFNTIAIGNFFVFLLIALMFCLDLRKIKIDQKVEKLFKGINIINLIFGYAIIFQFEPLVNIILNNYAYYFPDLIPWMMREGKPVLWFGPHSIAAFYIYISFFLCLSTYVVTRSRINIIFALSYIFFLYSLNSSSGFIFFAISLLHLAYFFVKIKRIRYLYISTLVLLSVYVFNIFEFQDFVLSIINQAQLRFSSNTNGLSGRYSAEGNMAGNLSFIKENPFSPIGMTFDNKLALMDSGYIIVWLRGSLPLLLLVYGVLFFYLRTHLQNKKTAMFIFFLIMAFEVGMFNMGYFRLYFLLPFVIVYLNYLDEKSKIPKDQIKPLEHTDD